MALLPQVTAVFAIGGFLVTGVFAYVFYVGLSNSSLVTLQNLPAYSSGGEHANKFGGVFAPYFMSPEKGHNESIWTKRAVELVEGSTEVTSNGFFTDAKTGSSRESLRNVCKSKYDSEQEDDNKEKWDDVWLLCSSAGKKILTLDKTTDKLEKSNIKPKKPKEKEGWKDKVGGDPTLKTKLVSVKSKENEWFWKIRDRQFEIGNLAPDKEKHKFIYLRQQANSLQKLSEICFDAYSMTKADNAQENKGKNPTQDELIKFCSISKA